MRAIHSPEELRRRFTGRPTDEIVAETALFRRRHAPTTPLEAARLTLRTLARRWEYLDDELNAIDAQLDELTASTARAAPIPSAWSDLP